MITTPKMVLSICMLTCIGCNAHGPNDITPDYDSDVPTRPLQPAATVATVTRRRRNPARQLFSNDAPRQIPNLNTPLLEGASSSDFPAGNARDGNNITEIRRNLKRTLSKLTGEDKPHKSSGTPKKRRAALHVDGLSFKRYQEIMSELEMTQSHQPSPIDTTVSERLGAICALFEEKNMPDTR